MGEEGSVRYGGLRRGGGGCGWGRCLVGSGGTLTEESYIHRTLHGVG